jgi:protein KTI12
MPLIIISGLPASGKSTRAKQLQQFFVDKGKKVHLLSENVSVAKAGYEKNEFFADSQKEKIVRADLKSEAIRQLNKEEIFIIDAGNYIKGYRYEIYCATKGIRTTQATIYCAITKEEAWDMNVKRSDDCHDELNNSNVPYTREIFDALCLRFEEPQSNNRWDAPLFTVFPNDELNEGQIFSALFENKPPPPNQSTQNVSRSLN